MYNEPRFQAEKEYEVLRNELLQGKKYVFERPILIITASVAFFNFEKQYAIYYPFVIIGLFYFNLWFTTNRLISMARIIAFIQVILDDKSSRWIGWETSLRHYRLWCKANIKSLKEIPVDQDAIYDNLAFYPPIYVLHITVTIFLFSILANFTIHNWNLENIIASSSTVGLLILFMTYAIQNRPALIHQLIEKHRVVWTKVFEDLEKRTKELANVNVLNDNNIKF